ncbi:MAG: trypsin-like peptidase domain-containing protein [Actinobacteria bacterium]|nr:trypsin-like peptidase domain-containing protein [Actinomycetota bacterium]
MRASSLLLRSFPALVALVLPARAQEALVDRRRNEIVDVVERVKPAVVSITTNVPRKSWPFGELVDTPGPSGTGAVIFDDGFIITNFHVVAGANHIEVRFDETDDDRVYDAVIVSRRPEEDLALLKITGEEPFHVLQLCESDPLLGETAIAIGNAYGHSHTVSTGIVSGLHRNIQTNSGLRFENLIQTDASINPGNSGGPLLNVNGELIGINTAMQGMAENIGFAIPVNHVRKVLSEQLLALSEAKAWLGFDVDETKLVVNHVVPEGPADRAGLLEGDRLVALAGHLMSNPEGEPRDVYRRVRIAIQPYESVPLKVQRGRTEHNLSLQALNKVDGILFERLGIGLETVKIGRGMGNSFLHVTSVQASGPAGVAGIQPGDVLLSVQRPGRQEMWFQRTEDLAGVLTRLEPGTTLTVVIWRDVDGNGTYFEKRPESDYSEEYRGPLTVR